MSRRDRRRFNALLKKVIPYGDLPLMDDGSLVDIDVQNEVDRKDIVEGQPIFDDLA